MEKKSRKLVIVRTYSAGVHFGELVSKKGKEVTLINSRRIWYWNGACSLSQLAVSGGSDDSKISVPVQEIELTEAIEIITCTKEAAKWLNEVVAWKK